jgi:hypothetical protein
MLVRTRLEALHCKRVEWFILWIRRWTFLFHNRPVLFWLCGQPSAFRGFCSNLFNKVWSVSYKCPYRDMVTFGMLNLIMWRAVSFLILSSETPRPARSLAFSFFAIAELNPLKLSELSIQHAAICLWAGWAGLCTAGHRTATGGYKTYCRERSAVAFYVDTKETKVEGLLRLWFS